LLLRQRPRPSHAWTYLSEIGLVEPYERDRMPLKVPQS
jgi:hypothetical protein